MKFIRKAGLPAILFLTLLLWLGCGDVFRPVANPILKPGGDPSGFHFVVAVNNNDGGIGSDSHIDTSGDIIVGNFPVGRGPVHAAFTPAQTQLFVADQAGDTVSFYNTGQFGGAAAGTPANTVVLSPGSRPVFVAAASRVYVANAGTNSVGVLSNGTGTLMANVPVGPNPAALVVSSDNSKVYCINKGNGAVNGTVTIIAAVDNTVIGELAVGRSPVAAALSPDGSLLFVVNQGSGTVSVINTVANALVGAPLPVGRTPTQLFVDTHLNRFYVANRGSDTVSVFDISGGVPALLKTVPVGTAPVSVTVLGDGSRAYVANSGSNNVTVIDGSSLTVKTTIPVGENPVYIATSRGDTNRVFVANFGPSSTAVCTTGVSNDPAHPECYGFISNIDTSTDTVVSPGPLAGNTIPAGTTLKSGAPRPVFLVPSS